MPELNLEDHSEEVQEILGRIPKWIIRWGITVLFALVTIIFVGSYFIPYPEKVVLPVTITALNAPAPIVARQGNNRIAKWFVNNQQLIKKGQLIAVWETDDNYQHVKDLKEAIELKSHEQVLMTLEPLNLPSFNLEIREYLKTAEQLTNIQKSTKHLREIDQLDKELTQKTNYLALLQKQRQVKEREFGLLEKQFQQDSVYYYHGGYGITKRDFESALLSFLQQKSSYIQYQASLIELNNSLNDLRNRIQEVEENKEQEIVSAKAAAEESLFLLEKKIEDWESQNLLASPIEGRLDRIQFWSENQLIPNGEVIGMVIPEDPIDVICRAVINTQSIGKIKEGQRALIKLDGFNAQQFGSVEGVISSLSTTQYNEGYHVRITLPNKLVTMDNVEIPLIQELTGTAEVLIDDSRLINKLINFKN